MYGLSWGAFNSLMTARRKPPALKAILIAHASGDLYYQDVHFIDGVMHADVWEAMIDTYNALPDTRSYALTPEFFADRFDREPWHYAWKGHACDGPFWRKESARFHPPVTVPVYIIGGLLDGYRDTVVRLLDSAGPHVKADIGPWKHEWPHTGTPGPNYEWRQRALRWWDHWLKGADNGVMDEPRLTLFVRDPTPPSEDVKISPGEWRCGNWPIAGIVAQRYYPSSGRLATAPAAGEPAGATSLDYRAGVGMGVHGWWGETSGDMSSDDGHSMVFDSEPLTKTVEVIGLPRVRLAVSADAPHFHWTVRLEDVWPDGKVSLVSGTLLQPADRESREKPVAMVPGQKTLLAGEIHFTTWRFKPGHRIRLAVGNAQFPMAWPARHKGSTKLHPGADTTLDLPVVEENTLTASCDLPRPEKEEWPHDASYSEQDEGKSSHMDYKPDTGEAVYTCGIDQKMTIGETKYHMVEKNTWKVNDADPARASYLAETTYTVEPSGRELRLAVTFSMKSDEKAFHLTHLRQLFENDKLVREKEWDRAIPRGHH